MRVVLVHALSHSIAPYRAAFDDLWPECQALDLLDETLYADLGQSEVVPPALAQRMANLLHHAAASGADALVFTGSTFGPVVEQIAGELPIPLLRADDAAALQTAQTGSRVAILATAARAIPVVAERVRRAFEAAGKQLDLVSDHVAGAQDALRAGRREQHDAMVATAAKRLGDRDVILLAQSSMAASRPLCGAEMRDRILTTPEATVQALRARFGAAG